MANCDEVLNSSALSGLPKGQKVTPECEVQAEGDKLETMYHDCPKNPNHVDFVSVSDFTIDHLPKERQTEEMMDYIKAKSNLTVRVVVRYISKGRPDKFSDNNALYPYSQFKGSRRKVRYGTGSVIYIAPEHKSKAEPCPCQVCEKSDQPATEYWRAIVRTATHVIYDDTEVVHSIFNCFYDSDDTQEFKSLYGCKILNYTLPAMDTYLSDLCHVECITHDRELVKELHKWTSLIERDFANPDYVMPLGILISHPHGCSKKITLGTVFHITYPLHQKYPDNVEAVKCRLPLFPWSKNSQEFLQSFGNIVIGSISKEEKENGSSHHFCPRPGTEFPIPYDDMTIAFPDNPEYALRYHYHQPNWYTLPPGCTFTLKDGTNVPLPPEAEFFDDGCVSGCCYVTYDVKSCPGSSGANLIHDLGRHDYRISFPHMGSLNGTINKSGLHYYNLNKRL